MRKELRFERRITPAQVAHQLKNINREVTMLKKRQEQILEVLAEHDLTPVATKALKEARATPAEKYVAHEDVKK